jgi:hypothetical protein
MGSSASGSSICYCMGPQSPRVLVVPCYVTKKFCSSGAAVEAIMLVATRVPIAVVLSSHGLLCLWLLLLVRYQGQVPPQVTHPLCWCGAQTIHAYAGQVTASPVTCLRGKEGNSGGHRSHAYTAMLCTRCVTLINMVVMSLFHAECFTVTAAGRPLHPAAVPRWYKGGA